MSPMSSSIRLALVTAFLAACGPQVVNAVSEDGGAGGSAADAGSGASGLSGASGTGGSSGTSGGLAGGSAGAQGGSPPVGGALVHRYSFDGTGTVAADSVGGADGVVLNTELGGDGTVVLAGSSSNQYVDLPRFIVSRLGSATFEAWVTWSGTPAPWQRIFDFGEDQGLGRELGPNDRPVGGRRYIFLTASTTGTQNGVARVSYQKILGIEDQFDAPVPLPSGELCQIAVVIDQGRQTLALFINGVASGLEQPFTDTLAEIYDINNWLGRSSYSQDVNFGGSFHEFRIYSFALSAEQIAQNFDRGPDDPAVQ